MPHTRPNVLVIVVDCGRADHFGCYGHHRPTTPNIDAIAREGVIYRNAISAAEWTVPSNASMFTGLLPSQHGAVNLHRHLDPGPPTLAEVLTARGYRTACLANNAFLTPDTGLTRGFQTADGRVAVARTRDLSHRAMRVVRKVLAVSAGHDDRGARLLNRMVSRWVAEPHDDRPFFVFTNFVEVHAPYRWLPRTLRRRYLPDEIDDARIDRVISRHYRDVLAGDVAFDATDYAILDAVYDSTLTYLDARLGELFAFLRRQGVLDDTLLIVTADHGDNLGDHGLMHHAYSLHETLVHVPLIVRYPPLFPAGTVVDDIVQTLDIFPTVLDVLGIHDEALERTLMGESVVPSRLLERRRRFAVSELTRPLNEFAQTHPHVDFTPFDRELRAIRTEEWKLIWSSDGRHELYHLPSDPREERNLIHARPEVARELEGTLMTFWEGVRPAEWQGAAPELDDTVKAHLEALGYID